MIYQNGDIVRLSKQSVERLQKLLLESQNLFFVEAVDGEKVKLRGIEEYVSSDDVLPVEINGEEDRDIYYDPVIAADVVGRDGEIKSHHIDKDEYYLDKLKNCYTTDGESYFNKIKAAKIKHVHELQHEFPSVGRDLRINSKIRPMIVGFQHNIALNKIAEIVTYKSFQQTESEWSSYSRVYVGKKVNMHDMIAYSKEANDSAYVLLFKDENRLEATYAEFYLNSSIGKLFLLKEIKNGIFEGNTNLQLLRKVDIRWMDKYKDCCVYLESLIQLIYTLNNKKESNNLSLSSILSFLSQLRDAMVLEQIMPFLFKNVHISIIDKWRRDTDDMMREFYQTNNGSLDGTDIIKELLDVLMSSSDGIITEMAKYRIYMSDFMKFAARNQD